MSEKNIVLHSKPSYYVCISLHLFISIYLHPSTETGMKGVSVSPSEVVGVVMTVFKAEDVVPKDHLR